MRTVAQLQDHRHGAFRQDGARGKAGIKYYISGATPGYRVVVNVTVTGPAGRGYCSTSFVPHA